MLKLVTLLFVILASCAAPSAHASSSPVVPLKGSWVGQTEDSAFSMKATITRKTIKIWLVADDMTALYWKGTRPKTVHEGETFTSKGDQKAMDYSLLGSDSSKKKFTIKDGKITFYMSIFGYRAQETLTRKATS